jgi:hypothetical protein
MFAIKSDKELAQRGADKPGQTLEKAAECLMGVLLTSKKLHLFTCNKKGTNFFNNSIKGRSSDEDTKRWGILIWSTSC